MVVVVGVHAGHAQLLRWATEQARFLAEPVHPPARGLRLGRHLDRLDAALAAYAARPGLTPVEVTVARIARELAADVRSLTRRVNDLGREITALVRGQAPQLLALPGCGSLTAAELIGETANPTRFRSGGCFAMHAGGAPIPASSGKTTRYRPARGGNRKLNAALHLIAVTHIRLTGLGQVYYQRRRARGDITMDALRALKRRLARVVFTLMRPPSIALPATLPAAA